MAKRDITGQPWIFNLTKQGEGVGSKDAWLRVGTFTSATTEITTMAAHNLGIEISCLESNNLFWHITTAVRLYCFDQPNRLQREIKTISIVFPN